MTGTTTKIAIEQVTSAAVEMYLATGRFHTARELAERLGCSERLVHERMLDRDGFVRDCRVEMREERRSIGPAYVLGPDRFRSVRTYGPTPECLRGIIAAMRASASTEAA